MQHSHKPSASTICSVALALAGQLAFGHPAVGAEPPGPAMQFLRAGEVRPEGWIREQMRQDLHAGVAGHYDSISGNVSRRLFETKPREPSVKAKGDRRDEASWWAGEHEGYWKDGVVRLAFLTGDEKFMARAREWIEAIVAAQAADGYIGIYTPETRLNLKEGAEAELWTQSRIFQAMLAYHEFTGDAKVLAAVEKAVQRTLAAYRAGSYFERAKGQTSGGLTHGIGFSDTLEQLYRLTGKEVYREGELWLYADFNRHLADADTALDSLLDAAKLWQGHTPHIMEGLAVPQIVHALTGDEKYKLAAAHARTKLGWHTTPGGAVVGDESVKGRKGTGATYGEYCSFTEGIIAMNQILAYSGDLTAGDWTERAALNGAQGARFQTANTATAYLSRDDRLTTDEKQKIGGRIYYSACHIAAACCTLNAARLLPYYVDGMWFRPAGQPALAANLYGPCRVATRVAGVDVRIEENTAYPFEDTVNFTIDPARPAEFTMVLRVPESARDAVVDAGADARVTRAPGRVEVRKRWQAGDRLTLRFVFDVVLRTTHDGQYYYQRGPLVYGLPFPETRTETIKFELGGKDSGFREYNLTPQHDTGWNYRVDKSAVFKPVPLAGGDLRQPWAHSPVALQGTMLAPDGKSVDVTLVPEGATRLRRVTFPGAGTAAAK
jgi:hypothetical protein